ncbi:MAG: Ribosomal small subunit methyltransferase [Chloroflexota bacterium]|nr:Ribosomal small subunit methyltransferase [Chloroflexota bacterium]
MGGSHGAGDAAEATGGILYVVATPIGNLGDVTMRALEVLRSVPLIAAEDTRITRRLLDRYEIATRTTSYHARSAPAKEHDLLAHLEAGADLALVTDAGTPVISDPGEGLVAAWAATGGRVVPVPGASAVLAAVAAAGLTGPRWSFEGFLPRSGRERRERLAGIGADERGSVLFEGPGRTAPTLRDLADACGPDRPGAVCRELTKLHETVVRGPLGELAERARDGTIPARGEVVIVVGWAEGGGSRSSGPGARRVGPGPGAQEAHDAVVVAARAAVERLVESGVARGEAARRVSAETGVPRRQLYAAGDAQHASGRENGPTP